jgi:hypothetical protein
MLTLSAHEYLGLARWQSQILFRQQPLDIVTQHESPFGRLIDQIPCDELMDQRS